MADEARTLHVALPAFFESPREVGEGRWLVGGIRVAAVEGGFRAAPEALYGAAISQAVKTSEGWIFYSDAAQRLWRASDFLGELELVAVAPEGVAWVAAPSGGGWMTLRSSDGLLYGTDGSAPPRPADGLENLTVLAASVSPEGVGRAVELGGRWLESDDGGRRWRLGGPADSAALEDLIYHDSGDEPSEAMAGVVAAALHRFDTLAAAPMAVTAPWMVARSPAGTLIEAFGTVLLVEADGEVARAQPLAMPEDGCRLHGAGAVLCEGGLWTVGLGGRLRRVVRWSEDVRPALFGGARDGEILVDVGCGGQVGWRCLVDLRSGEARTLEVATDLGSLLAFAGERVLLGSGSSLALVDLRTARAEPVELPSGHGDWHVELSSDQSVLFERGGGDVGRRLEARIRFAGRTERLSLPEGARTLHMFDARTGVVATDEHVLGTTDGGVRWAPLAEPVDGARPEALCRGSVCHIAGHVVAVSDVGFRGHVRPLTPNERALQPPLELTCDPAPTSREAPPLPLRLQIAPHRQGRRYTLEWNVGGRRRHARAVTPAPIRSPVELSSLDTVASAPHAALFSYCASIECGTLLARGDGVLVPLPDEPEAVEVDSGRWRLLVELGPTDHLVDFGTSSVVRVRGDVVERVRLMVPPARPAVLLEGDEWLAGALSTGGERRRGALVSPSGDRRVIDFDASAFRRGCEAPDPDAPRLLVPMSRSDASLAASVTLRLGPSPCVEGMSTGGVRWRAEEDGSLHADAAGPTCRITRPSD